MVGLLARGRWLVIELGTPGSNSFELDVAALAAKSRFNHRPECSTSGKPLEQAIGLQPRLTQKSALVFDDAEPPSLISWL